MKEFSTASKGINKDVHLDNLDNNSFSFLLNATVEDNTGNNFQVANESSNLLLSVLEAGEQVIASKYIQEFNIIILFTVNGNIGSIKTITKLNFIDKNQNYNLFCDSIEHTPLEKQIQIPLVKANTLVQSDKLNWSIKHRVHIQYKITDCTLNLYFVDGFNPDRFIYFDYNFDTFELSLNNEFKTQQGIDECNNPLYIDVLDVNRTKWEADISVPEFVTTETNGGLLKTGVYQVLGAYASSKGQALSSYLSISAPYSLFTEKIYDQENFLTSKALNIIIKNLTLNSRYRYFNVVIAETFSGFTEFKLVATLPISDSKLQYTYTGQEIGIKLSYNDIFQAYSFYKYSKYLAIANNTLFKAAPVEYNNINIQRIANKLQGKLRWFTVALKEGDFGDGEIAQNYRSLARDEVYSFGLQLYFGRGQYTTAGHIPARLATELEKQIIKDSVEIKDVIYSQESCDTPQVKRWQVYNTASITNFYPLVYDKCSPKIYQEGEFAYWESSISYPTNPSLYENNCNQPIRHHKTPDSSISHIHNSLNTTEFNTENYIFPMGVKLDDSVNMYMLLQECVEENIITQEEFEQIQGYRIVRGNRVGNASIQARGLLFDVWQYKRDGTEYFYPNAPFNDLRKDPFLHNPVTFSEGVSFNIPGLTDQTFKYSRKYTFHSPDTHFAQPAIGNILKIDTEEYGKAQGFFNKCENYAEQKLLSPSQYNLAIILGTILGEAVEFKDGATGQAQTIGQSIGSVAVGAGVAAATGGAGAGIGSQIGGVLGGLIGGAISTNSNLTDFWRANTIISQIEKILQLFKLIAQYENYHWQYQAVGKYNNYTPFTEKGNIQHPIVNSAYLSEGRQTISSPNNTTVYFNNHDRESSLYLEIGKDLPSPKKIDNSRFTISSLEEDDLYVENTLVTSDISCYYATIKNTIVNQYGTLFDINYLPTSTKLYNLYEKAREFGGDVFINRFALKRKHSYFVRSLFNLPNDTNIAYSDYPNVATPRYFFNTIPVTNPVFSLAGTGNAFVDMLVNALSTGELPQDIIKTVVDVKKERKWWLLLVGGPVSVPLYLFAKGDSKVWKNYIKDIGAFFKGSLLSPFNYFVAPEYYLDGVQDSYNKDSKIFNSAAVKGKIYMHTYGIPYFICESGVNVDMRHGVGGIDKDFYPNQQNLNIWLQQKNVPIATDNFYYYNKDYSKQIKEQFIGKYDINYNPNEECKLEHPNRVLASLPGVDIENSDFRDPYLYSKALDFHDFDYKNGRLVAITGIENSKVLVRFENKTQIFGVFSTFKTDKETVIISAGDIFKTRPQEFITTDNGYMGSQNSDFLSTPFGHIFVDAKRGNVFLMSPDGSNPQEISNKGLKNWFKENLPFTIKKYFVNVDVDNPYAGIGVSMVFDKRHNRIFITKLDYEPIYKDIVYDELLKRFLYKNTLISVYDKRFFINKSFTVGYNFYTQSWTFYSFTPNYYLGTIDNFITGLNSLSNKQSSLWVHNATNKSFQVFYGKLHPFVVETKTAPSLTTKKVIGIEYYADVIRFHKKFDAAYTRQNPFDQAIIYSDFQNSGELELKLHDADDKSEFVDFPKQTLTDTKVLVINKDNRFILNTFKNMVNCDDNSKPIWNYDPNNVNKKLNLATLKYANYKLNNNYIEGLTVFARLMNTKTSNKKIIFKGTIFNSVDE